MLALSRSSGAPCSIQCAKRCCHSAAGQAAGRVAGHHIALAQRVAAGIQRFVHFLCQRQPARAVGVGRVTGEDEAVVLVGGHGLFERPSEPKASQQALRKSMPPCWATRCSSRSVSTSFRWLISSVSWRACTPWPSRLPAKRRMSWRQVNQRSGTSGAARIWRAELLERQALQRKQVALGHDARRRAPRSVTGTWRMPWRDISSAASCNGVVHVRHWMGLLMTLPMGVCSGSCPAASPGPGCRAASGCPPRRRRARPAPAPSRHAARASASAPGPAAWRPSRPAPCARRKAGQARFQRLLGQRLRRPRWPARRAATGPEKCITLRFRKSASGGLAAPVPASAGHRAGQAEAVFVGGVGGGDGARATG
jgi:hypothetical protein